MGAFASDAFDKEAFDTARLVVVLDDGSQRTEVNLAKQVVRFWRRELARLKA